MKITGKSFYARKLLAFILIFFAKHNDLGIHDRFYVTYASLKKELVEGQLMKLLPEIRKAIDLYNLLYPNEYIEWKETHKDKRIAQKLLSNTSTIHFNRVVNGESYPYSQMDIISLNSTVISAGLSAHILACDELQNIEYEWVSKQAIPFLASTSGVLLGIGTANNDATSALFNYYKSESIPDEQKFILDWKQIYEYKRLISEEHANKYKKHVETEIAEKGIDSTVIQTEYFCNFNVADGKFITLQGLRDNNILTEDMESDISHYTKKDEYRIGSFDPAVKKDRAVFATGVGKFTDNLSEIKMKNIEIIKDLNVISDADELVSEAIKRCMSNNLDYLIMDGTAGQSYLVESLYKEMKKVGCKTQLIPFNYAGRKEKVQMCSYNETMVAQQSYKLPKEWYKNEEQEVKCYKILLDELVILEPVNNQNGGHSYKAPQGFNDDCAMVFFMLGYSLKYLSECINNVKKFTVGKTEYRLYYRKWEFVKKKKEIKVLKNWIF